MGLGEQDEAEVQHHCLGTAALLANRIQREKENKMQTRRGERGIAARPHPSPARGLHQLGSAASAGMGEMAGLGNQVSRLPIPVLTRTVASIRSDSTVMDGIYSMVTLVETGLELVLL